jgi:DNA repair protein RadC
MSVTYKSRMIDPAPDETDLDRKVGSRVTSSQDVSAIMRTIFADAVDESCYAIYLTGSNRILAIHLIGKGSVCEAGCSPHTVFRGALLSNAVAFILAHNHLSGAASTFPSAADRMLTESMVDLGLMMHVQCIDHVIVGEKDSYSFADNGLIEEYRKRSVEKRGRR